MKSTVFALFTLEAAHRLENVPDGHKCKRLHGHTYEVRVEVSGDIDPELGWVVDYAEIEKAWRSRVYDRLDHQNINDILPELGGNTTSELLAEWIRNEIQNRLPYPLAVMVEVWETATCGARTSAL